MTIMGSVFLQRCALRRTTIPILPCDCDLCDWYVHSSTYNRCFWVLACFLDTSSGSRFSFEEISEMEGLAQEDVLKIYESAINKIRRESSQLTEDENNVV